MLEKLHSDLPQYEEERKSIRQLAIIADDLTSATDCGVQVALSGFKTLALIEDFRISLPTAEVISLDTDTRGKESKDAYRVVKDAAISIRAAGYKNIYKSVDSTLRGNLVVEIDAVLDVFDFDFAMIAPAFPTYGRTTINGRHFLNGLPLTQTEFANDPRSPVREDDLVKLFSSQSKRKVGLVDIMTIRRGFNAVSEKIDLLSRQDAKLVIFDVQLEEDLGQLVEMISRLHRRVLWVGSTGLARHISRILQFNANSVSTSREVVATTKTKGHESGLNDSVISLKIVNALATITKQVTDEFELRGLILTGGETAKIICSWLGGKVIELLDEIEPGIPLGHLVGANLFVITKAGGFSSSNALISSLRALKKI
jgi:uncharacterized protein YgbK (DUF1537 family)